MTGDRRLVLAVAGPADLVAGRLEHVDHAVVEVALGGNGQADRVDRACSCSIVPKDGQAGADLVDQLAFPDRAHVAVLEVPELDRPPDRDHLGQAQGAGLLDRGLECQA